MSRAIVLLRIMVVGIMFVIITVLSFIISTVTVITLVIALVIYLWTISFSCCPDAPVSRS